MTPSKQRELILGYVTGYIKEQGFAPSLREISRAFGFASPRSAQKHLEALEEEGLIKRESKSRAIKLLTEPDLQTIVLPFLGYIAAGAPIEVLDHKETMEIPATLVGRRPCYILRVKGNSMIEDHILNGDFIVVEKCDSADDGEVVVALINRSEATLKRLYREPSRVRLEPANSTMKPIYVKDVAVQGKVRGLFRRF
ncbi:repressor LexA [candidate division WOR-1 bacterium RIFOXYA12_FULL_52_29]|uniref:LexA repressor n=1 Tax=candidate division WOR-1 bacterium RIFOXYC12_FULL_54_18 TaxID=1802584 RepID=A0A1F4T7T3_UNCSA|nr:MAG: repressor LexA [candidate division WOR-1 bacterium RIFOXYA2_FULL_51_19]OGC18351.1 MAG: repressor LexA [candidate division WOR-1 bacterium RIFOXYA12_FULL_52_29]OGC27206.1 MAG: repressor LexA [candidate division WOR-1 bacterium RIFOXYB2_FULL_45_9]OGC28768.1 MAG: repressor LexA [candidate division WOR-1 bacterium RIFOXYC12_FULL_54_18]OGC30777.1 MAG: repressor LexA [candidate division WOR-1 bacterium RIFOXYB12_FULL_52_16]